MISRLYCIFRIPCALALIIALGSISYIHTAHNNNNNGGNSNNERIITFSYVDEDLINIINYIASIKNINIVLPKADDAIKLKVTLSFEKKLTVDEAWNLVITILDIAGYGIIQKNDRYEIEKTTPAIVREPIPLYIGAELTKIPVNDQVVRYLYFLANIKVSDAADNEFNGIFKELLPTPYNATFKIDTTTNAILLTGKAVDVIAIMQIVKELDKVEFQESMDIITLHHAKAKMVADLFNENILKAAGPISRYGLDTKKISEAPYFSKQIRIVPEERANSLIIVGRAQAINRIKEFIYEYIDVEAESGKSILHVYQLSYLPAETFSVELQNIVNAARGTTEQARTGTTPVGGPEKFFDEVIIKHDKPAEPEKLKYWGGNKLIIAARNDDWERIKKLIQELDKPQDQVLIEVLIADLTIDDIRQLGSMIRNPLKIPILNQMNAQTSNLSLGVIPNQVTNPQTIGVIENPDGTVTSADLLKNIFTEATVNQTNVCTLSDAGTRSAARCLTNNNPFNRSTLISLNDNTGATWGILQVLKIFDHTKILSHPHIIATHNKPADINIGETRLVDDAAVTGGAGTVRNRIPYPAQLKISLTPRIASKETLNMQINIDINEFFGTANQMLTRKVVTNVNINTEDILSLGGLIRSSDNYGFSETPGLSQIPVLGWLFKKRQDLGSKTNLTVFIRPTIIPAKLRGGVGEMTRDYINVTKIYGKESALFDTLKDPVTRFFFETKNETADTIDAFIEKGPEFAVGAQQNQTTTKQHAAQQLKDKVQQDRENPFKNSKKRARAYLRS
jgi:general secretion pathway protein D